MSKFTDFYKKAVADEAAKKELTAILGDKEFKDATDEQLEKLSELAKKLGFDITATEAKTYLSSDNAELDDDELDAVAGGKVAKTPPSEQNPSPSLPGGDGKIYKNPSGERGNKRYYK